MKRRDALGLQRRLEIARETLNPAPLVASAEQIVPESLATVLGALTGFEAIHHRHFQLETDRRAVTPACQAR
ncbi:MAG TPA: hypothetical protein VJY34_18140 [Roseiarcus sp.]|nr:hypothetical protein [Roseiarcus sp.]